MNDLLLGVTVQLGAATAATWSLTEIVGRMTKVSKVGLALAFGPLVAIACKGFGFVPLIADSGIKGYAAVGFAGLIATLTAKAFHDLVANPLLKRIGGGV